MGVLGIVVLCVALVSGNLLAGRFYQVETPPTLCDPRASCDQPRCAGVGGLRLHPFSSRLSIGWLAAQHRRLGTDPCSASCCSWIANVPVLEDWKSLGNGSIFKLYDPAFQWLSPAATSAPTSPSSADRAGRDRPCLSRVPATRPTGKQLIRVSRNSLLSALTSRCPAGWGHGVEPGKAAIVRRSPQPWRWPRALAFGQRSLHPVGPAELARHAGQAGTRTPVRSAGADARSPKHVRASSLGNGGTS